MRVTPATLGLMGLMAAASAHAHFGGGSFAAPPTGVGPTISPVAACPEALVVSYGALGDIHTLPDPSSSTATVSQLGAFDYTQVLADLADSFSEPTLAADYDYVAMYTLGEVPGGVNPGYDFSGTLAKNIGYSNAYYQPAPFLDRHPTWWSNLNRAPHMNGIDYYRGGGGSGVSPWSTLFHQMAHAWLVEFGWSEQFGYPRWADWSAGDSPGFLAVQQGHWRSTWQDNLSGIMSNPVRSDVFNAFDLYAMGLLPYASAASWTYRAPEPGGSLQDVTLDDVLDVLEAKGAIYYEGDGSRVPATSPENSSLQVLVVVVQGADETMSDGQRDWLCDLVDQAPARWSDATWGLSSLEIGPPSPTPPSNTPPTLGDAAFTTLAGDILRVSAPGVLSAASDVDGDNLVATVLTGPQHGVLILSSDGSFSYDPELGFSGSDTFTVQASDPHGGVADATVRLTVAADTASVVRPLGNLGVLSYFGQTSVVSLSLNTTTRVRLELRDLSGGVLQTFVDGTLPPGTVHHRLADAISTPGTYEVRLRIAGRTLSGRLPLSPL